MHQAKMQLCPTPPRTFSFESFAIRTFTLADEPWFVAADVCEALTLRNSRQVITRLDADEKGVLTVDTLGGSQEVVTINESGLYALILTSRKPEAQRFKRWVTHEVLPAIRRTGSYSIKDPLQPELALSPAALDGRYMIVMNNGHFQSMLPVSPNHRGVDITDQKAVKSFLEEVLPMELLPMAIQAGVERLYRARRTLTA